MNISEHLIKFQNEAEQDFKNRKNLNNIFRYILAIIVFIISTLFAGFTLPLRLLVKAFGKKSLGEIQKMNSQNIDLILKKDQLVLVDFWAEWCGPCLMMNPVLAEFAENNKEVYVVKVNADTNRGLVSRFKIKGLPQFVLLQSGKEIKRYAGPMTTMELKNFCAMER